MGRTKKELKGEETGCALGREETGGARGKEERGSKFCIVV